MDGMADGAEKHLASMGLTPVGFTREEDFHVGCGEVADQAIARIEEMMGAPMSDEGSVSA